MRTNDMKSALLKSALAVTLLLSGASAALAQSVALTAAPTSTTLSDGTVVPMWGYSCGAASSATCAALNPAVASAQAAVAAAGATPTAAQLAQAAAWSPVVITVPYAGAGTSLSISLTNKLAFANGNAVPTSLTIIGQIGGGLGTGATYTASPDHSAVRAETWPGTSTSTPIAPPPAQGNRVQSFATEVVAGSSATLTWSNLQPGTYLIESGTHPSIQAPMGLYGILVVTDATTGTAYGTAGSASAITYNADVPVLFSEIDPVQNNAVAVAVNTAGFSETRVWSGLTGGCGNPSSPVGVANTCYPPAVNYTPLYFLVNGRTFDTTNATASLFPVNPAAGATPTGVAGKVMVRLANAGLKMHVPSIVGAQTRITTNVNGTATTTTPGGMTLVAEDGNPLPGQARVQNEVFMSAGKTYDVSINVPAAGATALPIYDRELSLSANATARDGGMLAYISVNGAGLPAAAAAGAALANNDTYNAVVPGQSLVISDPAKGVIANDTRVYGVSLLTPPTAGTVVLNANGTFTYTPTAAAGGTFGGDSFSYCANSGFTPASGSTAASCASANLIATVTLGASTVLASDAGVSCTPVAFTSTVSTYIAIKTPGVLSGCTDGSGLPLSLDPATITATGITVVADANGGFTATAAAAGTYSFSFQAKNSLGQHSAAASVTLTFQQPSGLVVNVVDGFDHTTPITDYRWIIEEDRTFYVDPACTTNPLPAGCPTIGSGNSSPINYGTNFHTSSMPVVATGCTGTLSCQGGQTLQGVPTVCDIGNGVCHPGASETITLPSSVNLDPSKRYYISVLPGDAANPFVAGYTGGPDCSAAGVAAGHCGHGMGGAPIAAACGPQSASKVACAPGATFAPVIVMAIPTPLPSATLSLIVYEDDYPLNGEQGTGGGIDVLAPQEPGLGDFQITLLDQAGQTGAATGTPTYDMFNEPLANGLAGTIDPVTGLDACPISSVVTANAKFNAANAAAIAAGTVAAKSTSTGMIVTCPKYESDGQTLSPMAGQALVKNLYPGRYSVSALPGASRIALGEEWVQTNTLDGQKGHDSFMRVGEPGYFQEFGPAGYHVSIGFANPKIINQRRYNDSKSGMCDPLPSGGALTCNFEVKGRVTGSRLSRTPDSRLYSSGDRSALAFTQCYVSLGDPDGAEIAFAKCDDQGYFDLKNVPAGNWKVTTFDQWNDQIIDGITQPVSVGCAGNVGGVCSSPLGGAAATANPTCVGPTTTNSLCDMGEIGVHQWQADLYTRTFIDTTGTGLSNDSATPSNKPGLALAATNVRFRDGSFSDFNNTDLNGNANFNEEFPLFNWYVVETDTTRYKTTGVHVIYDAGGPADGSASCGQGTTASPAPKCGGSTIAAGLANTYENYPLPAALSLPGAVYCANADCFGQSIAGGPVASGANSTGRIDPPYWFGSYGWQGFIGQGNFLEWGKKPYAANETGPIHGHVIYASTRPFDNPQLLLQNKWEPLVAHVTINLYEEGLAADGVTPTLKLIDTTQTSSWDDWAQGFRADGVPFMNCPGQQGSTDPFFYGLQNQPQYLDWYNAQHNGGTLHALPNGSQYKCYDGEHSWNQLQPAPYDGMYNFPSVTAFDPATGKPSGTNCTDCVPNPDTTDPYRSGTPMLKPGKYVVEVVVPAGYELVKEEDKNILIGDQYIAPAAFEFPNVATAVYILPDQAQLAATFNALNAQDPTYALGRDPALVSHEGDTGSVETFWPCVGEIRQVPDYLSLFPASQQVSPFAGAYKPLCDRKEVTLDVQTSALAKFYIYTPTPASSHFQGIILDDFAAEFDPFSPQFGEKFAPSYLPVAVKDWTGNTISRVYTDQFGLYNGLNYSSWEVNPPNPTGYAPTMMVMCMNDAGTGTTPDPLFQSGYSQFCYELPFMPGQTGYFDTPVVPVEAFASGSYNRPDCAYPDATPAIASVTGDVAGPWVSAPGKTITINALGNQLVDWYGYTGPSITTAPYNQAKITRHYGFGSTQGAGSVAIGGVKASVVSWSDTAITVTVPSGVPACAVQQQAQYGGSKASCGELVVTTGAGKQSIDTVTVTVGGKQPYVLPAGTTIQAAIDSRQPGDLIIIPSGNYNEMLVMWKPVRLQGVGAATTIIDANSQPAGKLLNPWRQKIVCLFGLTTDGRPDSNASRACTSGLVDATNNQTGGTWMNFPQMVVDRLPFEATLGWDASLNGNLAEQLIEPSLLGAYEGAAITVLGKGVKFPFGTSVLDAYGATTGTPGAAFPTNTTLLSAQDCGGSSTPANPYPTNYYCNPSSIDGLGIRDSSQGGGGIFVHAYAHNLQVANNRVYNNQGTMSGGITIGTGEHPDVALGGAGQTITSYPTSCESSNIQNLSLPFCFNMNVNVHNNAVVNNSSLGDELFSSTPAGAGGVSVNTGADYYKFTNNWVCGNLSSGDGGGFSHIGFIKDGDIEHNSILFNQSTNPSITTNGGGLLVMGAPDVDPTTCGVANDQDCVAPPSTIPPSDGTGPGLTINANLILGNAADSGSGGGLRIQHVNGTDVLNNPNGAALCRADLTSCVWNSVNVTNNIIVNNVAGWDGGGVSLLDALAVNIVNNTIASNDSTASSGTLFQALFAPLASTAAPTTNVICGANNGQSCPQVAGLVSVNNSPVLQANINLLPAKSFSCPGGHGVATATGPSCFNYSIPLLFNDVIWQNRSFYIGVGGKGAGNVSQQKQVTLYPAGSTTVAANQTTTGACPAGSSYWDIGLRGDTAPTNNTAQGFVPVYSVLAGATATTYGGSNDLNASPAFTSQYCNGSRTPPELGASGYAVPPGVNEFNAFPNPVFSLTASGVVDEGNNWVNVRWGPLALTSPATNAVLGNYVPATGSPAIDSGTASVTVGAVRVSAPASDYFGNSRPQGKGFDIGAVEISAPTIAVLSVTGGPLTFSGVVGYPTAAQTLTLSNSGPVAGTGIALAFSSNVFARSGGTCGATLAGNQSCTITVVYTAKSVTPVTGTLTITASVPVTGSPVALNGSAVAPIVSATLTPTIWTVTHAANCPGTTVAQITACNLDPAQGFTLTNTGNVPLTGIARGALVGTAPNVANWGINALVSTCGPLGGGQLVGNTTLPPGGTCLVFVQFKPLTAQAAGAKPATLSVKDSAGTQTATLNGSD